MILKIGTIIQRRKTVISHLDLTASQEVVFNVVVALLVRIDVHTADIVMQHHVVSLVPHMRKRTTLHACPPGQIFARNFHEPQFLGPLIIIIHRAPRGGPITAAVTAPTAAIAFPMTASITSVRQLLITAVVSRFSMVHLCQVPS